VPRLHGHTIAAALLLAGMGAPSWAGIYTCVDAQGRKLTADRPIPECIDREQKELTPSGTLKRKIGPSLTAEERAAEEEKQRIALEERNRLLEEKKRDRALLTRYPSKASHDKERQLALSQVDDAIVAARVNIDLLGKQRKQIDAELEFYAKDPSKIPLKLKRSIEEHEQHVEAQKRFIANQDSEKKRINERFDEELVRLRLLWGQRALPPTAAASSNIRK
jgi:hypothetical protein